MNTRTTNNTYTPYDILRWRLIARREAYLRRQRRTRQRRTRQRRALVVAIITTAALLAGFLFFGAFV